MECMGSGCAERRAVLQFYTEKRTQIGVPLDSVQFCYILVKGGARWIPVRQSRLRASGVSAFVDRLSKTFLTLSRQGWQLGHRSGGMRLRNWPTDASP